MTSHLCANAQAGRGKEDKRAGEMAEVSGSMDNEMVRCEVGKAAGGTGKSRFDTDDTLKGNLAMVDRCNARCLFLSH